MEFRIVKKTITDCDGCVDGRYFKAQFKKFHIWWDVHDWYTGLCRSHKKWHLTRETAMEDIERVSDYVESMGRKRKNTRTYDYEYIHNEIQG